MQLNEERLDQRMLAAHSSGDLVGLIGLYTQAAKMKEEVQDIDAACFYLTHAYIFALDAGAEEARALHARLKERGREE